VVPRFKAAERQGRYDVFAAPSEEGARRIFNEAREQRITKIVLDTVASSARRIYSCEGVVQGRSKSGSCARQCENSKNEHKKSSVTPTHNVLRRSELDTVASSARRIYSCDGVVQERSKKHHMHVNAQCSLAHLFAKISKTFSMST
jgi:hypothetical protein